MAENPVRDIESASLNGLLPALRRLDALLERATAAAQLAYGPGVADSFRGLYIGQNEVEQLLGREPGISLLYSEEDASERAGDSSLSDLPEGGSRLEWLQFAYGLTPFDIDVILIALAPELDRRYERLYAYLQDHVSRRRPAVDLVLNLLCPDAAARLERRIHFDAHSPLIRQRLIYLIPEADQAHPSLLAHTLKLDDQIVRFLLHQDGLDDRLAPFCRMVYTEAALDDLPLNTEVKAALPVLLLRARIEQQPLTLYFYGPHGAGKREAAAALTTDLGLPLLVVDLSRALSASADLIEALRLVRRYCWFEDLVPYLDDVDALQQEGRPGLTQQVLDLLMEEGGVTILAAAQPWLPSGRRPEGVVSVPFAIPSIEQRRDWWAAHLAALDTTLSEVDLNDLAGRFRLTPRQIAEAAAAAHNQARWRQAVHVAQDAAHPPLPITLEDLFTAARAQTGHTLAGLARKIKPVYGWDDIVLPPDALAQLREITQWVAHRHKVLGEWQFERKLSRGKGVNALFAGPSGTGKTMAAEIVARELGLDLYQIDLSGVVSKYIGETEKNLDRIFRAAENANAILFFDEADALFGKRSEVRDSHDRYANIEISYLLQKMEEYDGLSILATNLPRSLDEAFVRRLAFTIHFPFPEEADRRRIWAGIWPAEVRLAADVDLDDLARRFRLTGGNIKNVALAAAFLAAGDGGSLTMSHLRHATRREYQKLGKVLSEAELNGDHGGRQPAGRAA